MLNETQFRTGELIATVLNRESHDLETLVLGDTIEREITLKNLAGASFSELQELSLCVSDQEYQRLMAAVELGRRVAEEKSRAAMLPKIRSSSDAIRYCREEFSRLAVDGTREEFHVLTLDTKNHVTGSHQVTTGVLDASLVHPREFFRPAIKHAASSVIAVHNHPSGDPTPSSQDFSVTKRLEDAGELLGIQLLDHIIVAKHGARSVRNGE